MRCKDGRRKKTNKTYKKLIHIMIFINIWIISRKNVSLGRWKNNLKKTTFSNFHVSRFNSHASPNPIEVTITVTNYVFFIHEFFMQTVWQLFNCTKVNYAISCRVPNVRQQRSTVPFYNRHIDED